MPIYVIVDKDKDPLDPNEINAGDTITVSDGDIFIIDSSANDDITFEAAGGGTKDFEVWIDDSNSNTLTIEIKNNLNAEIDIDDNVDLSGFTIDADKANSVDLTAGNNVSLEKYEGSKNGADTLTIGNDFTISNDLKTEGGDDSIIIGDNASVDKIDTGKGDDSITIGDGLTAGDILTGNGEDTVVIGDDATVDKIDTGKGNDDLAIGDDFTGGDVLLDKGADDVTIGSGASLDKLDGGNGNDTLETDTPFPDAENFETVVCFAQGTMIRTRRGEVPIETLRAGDKVVTYDHGQQPIRWIGKKTVAGTGPRAPVRIAKGALGNSRELWVSQQHRMLVQGWRPEMLFGSSEVLVPAVHLVDGAAIAVVERPQITYFHLLFERHEMVLADGCYSESYHPGEVGMGSMELATRDEIYELFPELRGSLSAYGPAVRASLKSYEGRLVVAA